MLAERSPFAPRDGIELSRDARFAGRIRRLAATSAVALGVIALLWAKEPPGAPGGALPIGAALLLGWLSMPTLLMASLRRPQLRYLLTVPSGLVGGALVAVCASGLPNEPIARLGWLLITAGVWLGGILGAWFWFRLLPVPTVLADPFGFGRWLLVGMHVGPIVGGMLLVAVGR